MWFLVLVSTKGQRKDKNKFVTKLVGILVMVIFRQEYISSSL